MKTPSCYDYPLVIKKHLNYITISIPDLGITMVENLPKFNRYDNTTVMKLGIMLIETWVKAQKLIDGKAQGNIQIKKPSNIKGSIDLATSELSPTKFAKFVGVSKDTIIRDCAKGLVQAKRTTGGHYKIASSEIAIYKEYLKSHIKHAREPWTKIAMEKLREKLL
jgi:hypothetical protein